MIFKVENLKKDEEADTKVETTKVVETTTDWTMLAVGGIAALGFIVLFNQINISLPEAKQNIDKKRVEPKAPQAQKFNPFYMHSFYMQSFYMQSFLYAIILYAII